MRWRRLILCVIASLIVCLQGQTTLAAVKPHVLISDGMVLQRDMKVPIWGTADEGEKVTVQFLDQKVETTAEHGKWLVHLESLKPGGPFALTISGAKNKVQVKSVYVGDVWICSGQSNMEMSVAASANPHENIAQSKNPMIRLFTVPRLALGAPVQTVQGKWFDCGPQSVAGFSAVAYFFGRDLQKSLNIPIGLIHTSWGGTPAEAWTSRAALEEEPALKHYADRQTKILQDHTRELDRYITKLAENKDKILESVARGHPFPAPPAVAGMNPHVPASLYNGMIAPLLPYAIRGAIWYQGESNAGRAYEYRTLLPTMIKNWRADWKQGDFAFLIVQLAPFMKIQTEPKDSQWAELREAQLLTALNVPNTGIAVITDVGDEKDIHPKKKEPVGARLALAARAIALGEKVEYSGPIFSEMRIEDNKAILSFKHIAGGLVAQGEKLNGFIIAGEDRKFVNAEAEIQDNKIAVWSSRVTHAVAVRYGWADYPTGNLWNAAKFPASPFRTDDFPLTTGPKKAAAASSARTR